MEYEKLDLNLLVALDALLCERNVTRAAQRLFLSQSGMSHALTRLRRAFGDELLVRVGNRTELTPRAEDLAEPVREILRRVSNLVHPSSQFQPSESRDEFVVAMTEYAADILLPGLIADIEQAAPAVRLTVLQHDPEAPLPLTTGKVDIVVTLPARAEHPGLPLFQDEYGWVVAADHPVASGDGLTAAAIAEMSQAVYIGSRSLSDIPLESALAQLGLSRQIRVHVSSLAHLAYAVHGANVASLMPKRFFDRLWRNSQLRLLDLPVALPPIVPTMYWPAVRTDDAAHTWLRGMFIGAARKLSVDSSEVQSVAETASAIGEFTT